MPHARRPPLGAAGNRRRTVGRVRRPDRSLRDVLPIRCHHNKKRRMRIAVVANRTDRSGGKKHRVVDVECQISVACRDRELPRENDIDGVGGRRRGSGDAPAGYSEIATAQDVGPPASSPCSLRAPTQL